MSCVLLSIHVLVASMDVVKCDDFGVGAVGAIADDVGVHGVVVVLKVFEPKSAEGCDTDDQDADIWAEVGFRM